MESEVKKINSLLKFYYKENVEILLRKKPINITIKGRIIRKNFLGNKYIVIKGKDREPIKIFIEDIELHSILPVDYERKEKQKQRPSLNPTLRYKILKRDRHTCKSCGARAPEVELEVDHIIPVSKGGTDDENNLTTKCVPCNRGKSDRV